MSEKLPRLSLIVLGGTITMTRSETGGIVPTLTAESLLAAVPQLADVADVVPASPFQKPGASLTLTDLAQVARLIAEGRKDGIDGFVVVQGTDTIEETAFVLDHIVGGDEPVVVTGAMRGPQAAGADGPANLLASAIVAGSDQARGRGALVVLNDEIHAARFVTKRHTALTSAFRSSFCGPVGIVCEGDAVFFAALQRAPFLQLPGDVMAPPVAILAAGLGDDGRLIPILPGAGFKGAVVEAMGAGHVPQDWSPRMGELAARMPVILATRVADGPVFRRTYGFEGSERDLIAKGLIPAGCLSAAKARLLLQILLASGVGKDEIAASFASASALADQRRIQLGGMKTLSA
ncbi:asparaginase [Afifella pfennigii]|uniref:asparaginase n=1 Tax=Afifella pfennigii TaxID=209897 RepID=UPI00068B9A66|nr:asparaginase [Afifella pfennigii]